MRQLNLILGALACAFVAPSLASGAEVVKTANIAERGLKPTDFPRWHQIVPNVYAYEDKLTSAGQTLTTNSLIVVTTDGVVIVDGQDNIEQGKAMVANIKKITPQPVKYMIIASDHTDHVGANPALKEAWPNMVFISTPASKKTMEAQKREILATELVTDKRDLKVGGTDIQILNLGRGHTGGDLVVYLPQSKVMFMSELYDRYVFPPMITGFPSEWAATIKKAQAMDVTWYIPGHGFTDSDAATLKADLGEYLKATEHVISEAKRLRAAGLSCETEKNCPAHEKANWGSYTTWTLYPQQAPRALARVYMEMDGKLPK
jgi:glyoxylase-like metal-dependent hydrolase (beta-lactamase superfamily II)